MKKTIKDKQIKTNRELYLAVREMVSREAANERPLDAYLLALWSLGKELQKSRTLALHTFADLLSEAFEQTPEVYQPDWADEYTGYHEERSGFSRWQATLFSQIVDLKQMEADGTLENEYRYFGVDAPSGLRWYNFDPCTYLECATAGSFGGWREGDSGRDYVPGEVAVLENGKIVGKDPKEIPDPTVKIPRVSWEMFADFLRCGQWYE